MNNTISTARTLYDKLWDEHVVHTEDDGTTVLYIDRHLVHEVTSPQAFEGLDLAGRKVWSRVSTCSLETGSAMPSLRSVVGTLWSLTAKLALSRQTLRPARSSPSNACGLVTS